MADQITTLTGRVDTTDRHLFMVHEDLVQRIDASNEETRRQMRVLHEELVQRIATISEGR